ncbi:MAG: hypothetical protein O8C64_06850 [Candidatus Methanoperedens sp.]|nr:hypothetical protein [Candidatus Methanoperedens sp.]MCZ7405540.1 hypothetical protein [Candidatus Methanoperedens sp.]
MLNGKNIQKKYSRKHKKILDFLLSNSGKNLQKIERNLVVFSESNTPRYNIDDLSSLSDEDKIRELLGYPFIPHISPKIDLVGFNGDDGALVIVEIKSPSERADYGTFGQILYYMNEELKYINEKKAENQVVRHLNGEEVKNVRGIVLAHDTRISLKELLKVYDIIGNSLKEPEKLPKIILRTYHCLDKNEIIIDEA